MAGINVCATLGGNTGRPDCDVRMGRIKYLLLTTSKEFTETNIASSEAFEAALQTAMLLANSDANKIFAFPEMRDVTDNSGDPATGTLADGFEEVLNEALPKYLAKSTPGVCVQQAMASFNGWPCGLKQLLRMGLRDFQQVICIRTPLNLKVAEMFKQQIPG
jgi:hypothetical protein